MPEPKPKTKTKAKTKAKTKQQSPRDWIGPISDAAPNLLRRDRRLSRKFEPAGGKKNYPSRTKPKRGYQSEGLSNEASDKPPGTRRVSKSGGLS